MNKKLLKKIGWFSLISLGIFITVISVHIYMVTRPKPLDPNALAMARIDIKNDIKKEDAEKITTWLYQQKGIDHVLVNPDSKIAVFSFYPARVNANDIVMNFKKSFPYQAERFMPSAEEMAKGCPVAPTSTSYKVVNFFKNL